MLAAIATPLRAARPPGWHADWLVPDWPVPGVCGLMTTRAGGVSAAPFDSMNLRDGLGDEPSCVASNRGVLAAAARATPVYTHQVHGARVVRLTAADALPQAAVHTADASFTTEPLVACAVQVADCLPVLFAAPNGRAVGAAHAGWRGLALGVLEATVAALCDAGRCEPAQLHAWLGACIGPGRFEVGADVLEAFGVDPQAEFDEAFMPMLPGKWLADLPWLARQRLAACGVNSVSGGTWCTATHASRFFSFRRDRVTGRMAALVWIDRRC